MAVSSVVLPPATRREERAVFLPSCLMVMEVSASGMAKLAVAKAAQVGLQMEEYHRPSEEEKKQMEQAVLRHHGHRWEGSV